MVAANFIVLKAQYAFGIRADAERLRLFVRDVITTFKIFRRARKCDLGPSNSSIVVVPTSHAPMPKLAAVDSNSVLSCL